MTFSISASGHIDDTLDQAAQEIEAELVKRLQEAVQPIVADAKFGLSVLTFYGQHTGTINLAAPGSDGSAAPGQQPGQPAPGQAAGGGQVAGTPA